MIHPWLWEGLPEPYCESLVAGPNGRFRVRYRDARGAYATAARRQGIPALVAGLAARLSSSHARNRVMTGVDPDDFERALSELLAGDELSGIGTLDALGFDAEPIELPARRGQSR